MRPRPARTARSRSKPRLSNTLILRRWPIRRGRLRVTTLDGIWRSGRIAVLRTLGRIELGFGCSISGSLQITAEQRVTKSFAYLVRSIARHRKVHLDLSESPTVAGPR